MKLHSLLVAPAALLTLALAPRAQDGTEPDHPAIEARIDAVLEKPEGQRYDSPAVAARIATLRADLGENAPSEFGYLASLQAYFERDYTKAVAELEDHFEAGLPIHNPQAAMICGRIALNGLSILGREGGAELAKVRRLALKAAELYPSPRAVARLAMRAGTGLSDGDMQQLRLDLLRTWLLYGKSTPDEIEAGIRELYPAPAADTGRGPAPAARATPARRPEVTAIEPFEAKTIDGDPLRFPADYAGKVVLLDFWATWCGPCLRKAPEIVAAHEKFKDQGFEIVGISLDKDDAEAKVREVAAKYGMAWPHVYEGGFWETRLARANGIRSIPAIFLFDKQGKLRYTRGDLSGEDLQRRIAELLAEPPAK